MFGVDRYIGCRVRKHPYAVHIDHIDAFEQGSALPERVGVRNHALHAGIVQHSLQAFGGISRIERHESAARTQHAHQCSD
ncbi:hypothetical protein YK56LOC_36170 [Caballeronia sp. HLA56]